MMFVCSYPPTHSKASTFTLHYAHHKKRARSSRRSVAESLGTYLYFASSQAGNNVGFQSCSQHVRTSHHACWMLIGSLLGQFEVGLLTRSRFGSGVLLTQPRLLLVLDHRERFRTARSSRSQQRHASP
jgi:hypothetical protein